MILDVEGLCAAYVGLSDILFGVNLHVERGEVVALIGRNGVGKTTTFRSIMGLLRPKAGEVRFKGEDITGRRPHQIALMGVGLVPGDRQIFMDLTVWENLDLGRKKGSTQGVWTVEKIFELFPALDMYQKRKGGNLSGGEQQMLAIARTLMGNPELVLMDEPSEGLAPLIVRDLRSAVLRVRDEGISILLAEQNFEFCAATCSRAYVMEKGQVVWQGQMKELEADTAVKSRYLLL
ncbi:MAG TPA: ABC transporter ATP-binding protein [Thermoleophilia bacterium]|jgi:branched-chain amino acid transport system ATP-binding protein|nr:ABC transporter ATP-binding protein [Thermoleophilia bacterium]